jgi:hypothetical protein
MTGYKSKKATAQDRVNYGASSNYPPQPAQEPVAWRFKDPKDGHWVYTTHIVDLSKKYWRLKNEVFEPLYTAHHSARG